KRKDGIFLNYSDKEKFLLDYLEKNDTISQSAFTRKARITFRESERILSDFIVLGIIELRLDEKNIRYGLSENFNREEWETSHLD
ncbi:MAG TPA: hypothetical protein VKA27_17340, partial [Sunxiuqinia sp.]|nr:hypothetical protein [Sunxiuqinia sp.]